MREITVTEGLVELKTLGSRIEKAMDTKFVAVNKNPAKGSDDEKQFIKTAKEKYQSVTGLIKERQKVKSAIVESNAITKVVIAGEEMTVAEAIERKSSIQYEKTLLMGLKMQFSSATNQVEIKNGEVERRLDSLLEKLISSDKNDTETQKKTAEMYRADNGYYVVDPIGIQGVIDALEKSITDFEAEVDVALSVSNARTVITVG